MGDTSSLITVFLGIALLIFWRRYRSMHKPIKDQENVFYTVIIFNTRCCMVLVQYIQLYYK